MNELLNALKDLLDGNAEVAQEEANMIFDQILSYYTTVGWWIIGCGIFGMVGLIAVLIYFMRKKNTTSLTGLVLVLLTPCVMGIAISVSEIIKIHNAPALFLMEKLKDLL